MRVWDIHPGYLNRQSLLGEHQEIHALLAIVEGGKRGYAHHPETLRWREHLGALRVRHEMVVAEMRLRGYRHHTPVRRGEPVRWPQTFVDPPLQQFAILRERYREREKEPGRIPLPRTAQQAWAQHQYSVLARDPVRYRLLGQRVAAGGAALLSEELALELVEVLRKPPTPGGIRNALEHMWGYVRPYVGSPSGNPSDPQALLVVLWELATRHRLRYLLESTALSDLAVWLDPAPEALVG
ncbi:MAG: DUF1722 domain-containing protein [Anaerolineae bacterium]